MQSMTSSYSPLFIPLALAVVAVAIANVARFWLLSPSTGETILKTGCRLSLLGRWYAFNPKPRIAGVCGKLRVPTLNQDDGNEQSRNRIEMMTTALVQKACSLLCARHPRLCMPLNVVHGAWDPPLEPGSEIFAAWIRTIVLPAEVVEVYHDHGIIDGGDDDGLQDWLDMLAHRLVNMQGWRKSWSFTAADQQEDGREEDRTLPCGPNWRVCIRVIRKVRPSSPSWSTSQSESENESQCPSHSETATVNESESYVRLALVADHVIADAIGITRLLQELTDILEPVLQKMTVEQDVQTVSRQQELTPVFQKNCSNAMNFITMEKATSVYPSVSAIINELTSSSKPKKEKKNIVTNDHQDNENDKRSRTSFAAPYNIAYGVMHAEMNLSTFLVLRKLSSYRVKQLVNACRNNNTTVHGALSAAAIQAYWHFYGVAKENGRNKSPSTVISYATPVSLRDRIASSAASPALAEAVASAVENFIIGTHADYDMILSPQWQYNKDNSIDSMHHGFWSLARECRSCVVSAIDDGVAQLGLLRIIDNKMLASILTKKQSECQPHLRTDSLEVSNIGVIDAIPSPSPSPRNGCGTNSNMRGLEDIVFFQGNHYMGPVVNLSVVTNGKGGDMNIVLCLTEQFISRSEAEKIWGTMDEIMQVACLNSL